MKDAPVEDGASALAYNVSFYAEHYRNPLLRLRYDLIYRSRRLHRLLRQAGIDACTPGFRILEYGFGAGHMLRKMSGASLVVGLEFSPSAVRRARLEGPRGRRGWHILQWFDPGVLPFQPNSFDMVVCSHVLEHLPDDRGALREFVRITRPGGHCLIVLPAHETLFPGSKHLRLYDIREFVSRLQNMDLRPVFIDEHQRFDRPWKEPGVILASRKGLLRRIAIEGSKNLLFLPPLAISWGLLGMFDRFLERCSVPSTSVAYLFQKLGENACDPPDAG